MQTASVCFGKSELLTRIGLQCWIQSLNFVIIPYLKVHWKPGQFVSSSLWNLHFSSLLGPNARLRILLSNTLRLHLSLNVRDHVSQSYSIYYLFKFKRKIRTWTGIWTLDLQISSLALYHPSYPGSIDGTGLNLYFSWLWIENSSRHKL